LGEEERTVTMAMSETARTTYEQFGGNRAMFMLGGRAHYSSKDPNFLGVKWPNKQRSRGNYVEIRYVPGLDLYTMEFFNSTARAHKSVKKYEGVYGDQLRTIFEEQTGWYLSL
jgi:hypothetical protein